MPRRPITPLVELCREIGLEHLQATELFRRIDRETENGNDVIVQEFGTFYRKFNRARVRVLNGDTINVPANDRTALRGQRFPSSPRFEGILAVGGIFPDEARVDLIDIAGINLPHTIETQIRNRRMRTYELDVDVRVTVDIVQIDEFRTDLQIDFTVSVIGLRPVENVEVEQFPIIRRTFGPDGVGIPFQETFEGDEFSGRSSARLNVFGNSGGNNVFRITNEEFFTGEISAEISVGSVNQIINV